MIRFSLLLWVLFGVGRVWGQPMELDSTFGVGGVVYLDSLGTNHFPFPYLELNLADLVSLPNGSALMTHVGDYENFIVQIDSLGQQIRDFGLNGKIDFPEGEEILDCFLQSETCFVASSVIEGSGVMRRYSLTGVLDSTFGMNGAAVLNSWQYNTQVRSVTSTSNGAILLSGSKSNNGFVARYDAHGHLDTTFGLAGFRGQYNYSPSNIGYTSPVLELPSGELALFGSYGINFEDSSGSYVGPMAYILPGNGIGQPELFGVHGRDRHLDKLGRVVTYHRSIGPITYEQIRLYKIRPVMQLAFWTGYAHSSAPGSTSNGHIGALTSDVLGNTYASFLMSPNTDSVGWKISRFHDPLSVSGNDNHIFTTLVDSAIGRPIAMGVLPDGKLLVAGYTWLDSSGLNMVFARYHNIPDPRAKLNLRMALGGAMDTLTGIMRDDLRLAGLLPTVQPYSAAGRESVNGIGQALAHVGAFDVSGEEAVVDWVWLELLSTTDTATVVATRVGLLHRNGTVTQADGHSPIDFSVGTGSYFLRVAHRNHLGATLSTPIELSATPTAVDLTAPSTTTFGTDAQWTANGMQMLWPGDVTANGQVKYTGIANDRDPVLVAIGGDPPTATAIGYSNADVTMDGVIKYTGLSNDRDVILQCIGGNVPTAVRTEQRP